MKCESLKKFKTKGSSENKSSELEWQLITTCNNDYNMQCYKSALKFCPFFYGIFVISYLNNLKTFNS